MEKEDLIIEFYNTIQKVEDLFIKDRIERHEYFNNKYNNFFDLNNEEISIPFNHEFYLKGYKCKINLSGTLKVIE